MKFASQAVSRGMQGKNVTAMHVTGTQISSWLPPVPMAISPLGKEALPIPRLRLQLLPSSASRHVVPSADRELFPGSAVSGEREKGVP